MDESLQELQEKRNQKLMLILHITYQIAFLSDTEKTAGKKEILIWNRQRMF